MKAILTLDLQEDNGTSVFKASQTKNNFAQIDYDLVVSFLVGADVRAAVEFMCWMAGGTVPKTPNGTTVTINQLAVK
jgi:hypothetical protein